MDVIVSSYRKASESDGMEKISQDTRLNQDQSLSYKIMSIHRTRSICTIHSNERIFRICVRFGSKCENEKFATFPSSSPFFRVRVFECVKVLGHMN